VRPARTYFLDDACTNTVQVLRIYTGPASCGPLPPPRGGILYRDDPNNACVPRADVFRGGDEILAPLYQGAVGECSLVSRTNAKFYATTPVAATDLVEITTVVDP
jgi:hypothetical protein